MTSRLRLLRWLILIILIFFGTIFLLLPVLPEDLSDFFTIFFRSDDWMPGDTAAPSRTYTGTDILYLITSAFFILLIWDSFRRRWY